MREILFRGKRMDNGEWVYGIPAKFRNVHNELYDAIIEDIGGEHSTVNIARVNPDTVGRYTGLTDKSGVKIFEGDIVLFEDSENDCEGYHDNVFLNCGEVIIETWGGFAFTNRQTTDMEDYYISETEADCEIIGNIHDNPELLNT